MKYIIIVCVFFVYASAKSITVAIPAVCCPTKDQVSDAYKLISNKKALMRYMYKNECTLVNKGDIVNRVDASFTMVKIINDWGAFWCPREIE